MHCVLTSPIFAQVMAPLEGVALKARQCLLYTVRLNITRWRHGVVVNVLGAYSRTSIARATSQTVCDRHRTCDTTYSRKASQNLRPAVARAITYATSYIHFPYLVKAYQYIQVDVDCFFCMWLLSRIYSRLIYLSSHIIQHINFECRMLYGALLVTYKLSYYYCYYYY